MSPLHSHTSHPARRTLLAATAAGLGTVALSSCGLANSILRGNERPDDSAQAPEGPKDPQADGTGDTTTQESSASPTQGSTTLDPFTPYLQLGKEGQEPLLELFVDYLCPYCKKFSMAYSDFLQQVSEEASVDLRIYVRPMLDANTGGTYSRDTASCAAAAYEQDPALFWTLDKVFYDNQPSESGPLPSPDDVYATARDAGLEDTFLDNVKGGAYNAFVDAAEAEGRDRAIGTPTLFINGTEFTGRGNLEEEVQAAITQSS